jgi:hypothetical protein
MAIADASGFPVAAHIESASPHEVKLVDKTIDNRFVSETPRLKRRGILKSFEGDCIPYNPAPHSSPP